MIELPLVEHYPQLIDFMYQIIQSLKGVNGDWRRIRCHDLATKLFFHDVTIGELRNGTNLKLSDYKDGAHIVDFPSITVLARACLETYLRMFEVYFEPLSEDEFDYRHAVYELHGFVIRETHIPQYPDPNMQKRVEATLLSIDDMRKRVKTTNFYQKLDRNQQKQSLRGNIQPNRSWDKQIKAAGFGQKFISKVYAYQSAYVHADSLSAAQISEAVTDELRNGYVETSMGVEMMVLAKTISNYTNFYSTAKVVFDANPTMRILTNALSRAASSM